MPMASAVDIVHLKRRVCNPETELYEWRKCECTVSGDGQLVLELVNEDDEEEDEENDDEERSQDGTRSMQKTPTTSDASAAAAAAAWAENTQRMVIDLAWQLQSLEQKRKSKTRCELQYVVLTNSKIGEEVTSRRHHPGAKKEVRCEELMAPSPRHCQQWIELVREAEKRAKRRQSIRQGTATAAATAITNELRDRSMAVSSTSSSSLAASSTAGTASATTTVQPVLLSSTTSGVASSLIFTPTINARTPALNALLASSSISSMASSSASPSMAATAPYPVVTATTGSSPRNSVQAGQSIQQQRQQQRRSSSIHARRYPPEPSCRDSTRRPPPHEITFDVDDSVEEEHHHHGYDDEEENDVAIHAHAYDGHTSSMRVARSPSSSSSCSVSSRRGVPLPRTIATTHGRSHRRSPSSVLSASSSSSTTRSPRRHPHHASRIRSPSNRPVTSAASRHRARPHSSAADSSAAAVAASIQRLRRRELQRADGYDHEDNHVHAMSPHQAGRRLSIDGNDSREELDILMRVETALRQLERENAASKQKELELSHQVQSLQDSLRVKCAEKTHLQSHVNQLAREKEQWKQAAQKAENVILQLQDQLAIAQEESQLVSTEKYRLNTQNKELVSQVHRLDSIVYGRF